MRFLLITKAGILDTNTGELYPRLELSHLIAMRPGGIIAVRNGYEILASLVTEVKRDHGATLKLMDNEKKNGPRVKGYSYFSNLYYRFEKEKRSNGVRYRPGAIRWPILNLELYCEPPKEMTELEDIEGAARALYALAEARGITVRTSPGSFGSAMLRASKEWEKGRHAAPWFISEEYARPNLPGNLYQLRSGYRTTKRAYYLDQKSSHHNIVASIGLPHPHYLRARWTQRARSGDITPPRIHSTSDLLYGHIGLLYARIECDTIPAKLRHLYPKWALEAGEYKGPIWTPELRLLDRRVRLRWIYSAFTAKKVDPALPEYAKWALSILEKDSHAAIKPALLAAYGMLGITRKDYYHNFSVHGRSKPPRATVVKRPLIGDVYRSDIKTHRPSSVQNVIARGVIEAECLTRTIEMARKLESEGHEVVHLYADGLLTTAEQLPFLPEGWRVQATLTDVTSPHPNSLISREIIRMPGIPNGRRTAYIREDAEGERVEGDRPSFHLREQEPRPA